jgi:hypothetical protein
MAQFVVGNVHETYAEPAGPCLAPSPNRQPQRTSTWEWLLLFALTAGAVLIHGYHGGAEDAEIYLPGILKALNPALFPWNTRFFESHAGMTLFPQLIAESVRLTHLPAEIALLVWHFVTIFGLLWACFRIARLCFRERHAAWCGVALVAALLTLPVAGTALYIMDQYVTSRSFSTAASMLALASILEKRRVSAALWIAFTAVVHPLMSLFALALVGSVLVFERDWNLEPVLCGILPATLFPPVSPAYREVLRSRPYFLLTNWAWYEWLGIVAPIAVLWAMAAAMRHPRFGPAPRLLKAVIAFEAVFFGAALWISMPGGIERFAEIQPMRCLLLVYIVMLVVGGGLLGEFVLRRRVWRWALLFLPLSTGMAFAQYQLFPSSPHLEWPWAAPRNSWVEGWNWIRTNLPQDAYFALDPDYERLPGEDEHGFRAIAQRSMLADSGKDEGAVSMFPALAREWSEQVQARRGWREFERADFERLKARYGVDWVVLQQPGTHGLDCPYQNDRMLVCRIR